MNIDEQAVTGSTYTRCYSISINNPVDAQPIVDFAQEIMLKQDTGTIRIGLAPTIRVALNPEESFPWINPLSGESAGTMTQGELYTILYAAWLHYRKG